MKILLLLISHFMGDYIFQSSTMAKKKRTSLKYLFLHCLVYSGFMLSSLIWFGPTRNTIGAALIIILSHAAIDYSRNRMLDRKLKKHVDHKAYDFVLFIADQVLHILIIVYAAHMLTVTSNLGNTVMGLIFLHISPPQLDNFIIIVFLYLLCLSPAAVFIKKVFIFFSFQSDETQKEKDDLIKSGYIIGVLERVIMLTLGLNGQLGAIGFVLAAKSLARFNQLNDREFAEKYLVGTLLSVVIALFCITLGNSILIK